MNYNPFLFPDELPTPKFFGFDPAWSERTIDGREIIDVEYEEISVERKAENDIPQDNIISKQ